MNCRTVKIKKLDITLAVMADGETGCWSDISCSLSSPLYFETAINCAPNPIEIQLADVTICEGGCIDVEPKISGVVVYTQQYPGVMVHKPYCVNYVRK